MKIKTSALLIVTCLLLTQSFAQTPDHWETIIQIGDNCRYYVPTSDIGTNWREKNYDDSSWPIGQSGFGYGDNDDNTEIPMGTKSVYMRFEFAVGNRSDIADLFLDMDYDDGFVAFINGIEVARYNVPDPISWDMELENIHEAGMYNGLNPERFDLTDYMDNFIDVGKNILCVEVHNAEASSSDMTSNVFLHAGITVSDTIYGPTSEWFWLPKTYTEFNLPLMIINTNGQEIPDEPRIVADMGLIYNGEGEINSKDDPWNEYSGKISIEQRGESSIGFAKKSFSIETQNDDGSNNNIPLLGLPKENDWVLYGPYSDKTMVKNVLTYELFRRTGRYAPRTRYIEVIVNDSYEGVYVLTEKIKQDKNRVDVDKLTENDVDGTDITGGYLLRRDKRHKLTEEEYWTSDVNQPYHERMWYEWFDPDYSDLILNQRNYIKDWMHDFDAVLSSSSFKDTVDGYRKYIRTRSFIDMMFINEISKGIDNYLFSTYFYKENDTDGGQLVAGPPWDYNLGYGNLNYGHGWNAQETFGWCYTQGSRVYWYERLMEDSRYRDKVYDRWTEFRNGIFATENILGIIDSCVNVLGDAVDRNFERFPTLGHYIWPAIEPIPETYEEEVYNMKTWLVERLEWIDEQWYGEGDCDSEKPTDITLSNKSIVNNKPIGTLIGFLTTSDRDSDTHTYSLVTGDGADDNDKFQIDGDMLKSLTIFDGESQKTCSIRIKTQDECNKSFAKAFEIKILNLFPNEISETDQLPVKFDLKQNYPNPFNPTTKISYSLANDGLVQLTVYDLQGNEVANLVNKIQSKGRYEINFNASSLTSGIYLYRIQTGDFTETKKLILLQ